ncbi:molybdenum cofactor guanylyltransferase [Pseudoxanthomonas sp. 3HH-4]|uniref:molybdenum cofactor guanylyltransferase n=1 Tax=Pseudoxanthomonas sp. 3HH-4 TaxID=1690214 RepID=UPI0021070A1D|nr:molybdenum cofactor guanylyltransferase [Pseudoxanthomonas sp. 3HH-4]
MLSGGQSRRMQQDKAYLGYQGQPQLQRAYALLQSRVDRCFISVREAQTDDALRSTLPQIVDQLADCGPVAGILAAMHAYPDVGWLVIACDLPLLDAPTLQRLITSRFHEGGATAYASVVDARPEPLCAIWEPSCRTALHACIDHGGASLRHAMAHLQLRLLDVKDPTVLINTNTPADASYVRTINPALRE